MIQGLLAVTTFVGFFSLFLAILFGWLMNIVALVQNADTLVFGVKTLLMIIGVFFPPLGSLIYWLG
jgi:hypothetical protein